MTKLETWNSINDSIEKTNILFNLCDRWYDESDYESVDEYLKYIQENLCANAVKILKRPFSFIAKCDDGYVQIGVKVSGCAMKSFVRTYKGKVT